MPTYPIPLCPSSCKLVLIALTSGDQVRADSRRFSRGFSVSDVMRRNDDELGGTPLVDPAGGATVFLDTRVRLERIG